MAEKSKTTEKINMTNRKWQNHFKAKGFIPFMYDRLASHAFSAIRQYRDSPFNFTCKPEEEDPLKKYFFEFSEEFPYMFYIEVTNECNLDCIFCARKKMKRKRGFMPIELYKKIIDEIAEKRPFSQIHLYGVGEPTLDPQILDKIRYALSRGLTNIILFTNGKNLLKDDFYKKLVDSGIMCIGIDFDGFSKEAYEKIRVGANFEDLKKAVILLHEYIRKNNLNTRVELAYQPYKGINENDLEPFIEWAEKNDYEYKITLMHHWGGLRKDIPIIEEWDDSRDLKRTSPCCALWHGFMIYWNGDVGVCFQDADSSDIMGSVKDSSIEEVWKAGCKEKRRNHVKGIFTGLCKECREFTYNELPKFNSSVYPRVLKE